MDPFDKDFTWGVSASAYQIEGAVGEDGRGVSVWDTFCATQGKVVDGHTGAVAADHYHRYREDVELIADLGVDAYRFSFAWPRIQPDGAGKPNALGLDFYDRLLDALLDKGIRPVGTLYHWDTPQPVEDAGGWLGRDTVHRFAEYAAICGEHFADRVDMWIPVNEPMVTTLYGYAIGEYAPGKTLLYDAIPAAHHQNLAHGLAVTALRSAGAKQIGTANNHSPIRPVTPDDIGAAAALDDLINGLFADPVLLGTYPDSLHAHLPDGFADDLPSIREPLDFYGVNYYEPLGAATPGEGNPLPFELRPLPGFPLTANGSAVDPAGLTGLLVDFDRRFGSALPPIHITENGCSGIDEIDADGAIHDDHRVRFLADHVDALVAANATGVDVRGYFVWSILDNFEWSKGYHQRFGLVHVDFESQRRTRKDSFTWLRTLLSSR
jgi:beta-glucosidase